MYKSLPELGPRDVSSWGRLAVYIALIVACRENMPMGSSRVRGPATQKGATESGRVASANSTRTSLGP